MAETRSFASLSHQSPLHPFVYVSIPQSSAEGLWDGVSRGVEVTGGRRFGT